MVDHESVFHMARLAILAMSARAVAVSEFETDPEVCAVVFVVSRRSSDSSPDVDVEFRNSNGLTVGGMVL